MSSLISHQLHQSVAASGIHALCEIYLLGQLLPLVLPCCWLGDTKDVSHTRICQLSKRFCVGIDKENQGETG